MAKELIFLVEESLDTGYEARALGYSIFTEGETIEDIRKAVRDAVVCHFEQEEMPAFVREPVASSRPSFCHGLYPAPWHTD